MTTLRQAVLAKLEDQGIGISKLVTTVLDAVAEVERDMARERLAIVKADRRQLGRYLGGSRPFGFKADAEGRLIEDPAEQAVVGQMKAMRAEGMSLRAIAARLAEAGTSVSHVTVRAIVNADGPRTVLRGDARRVQVAINRRHEYRA
jgi:putative DNA-invertase from lambdoid prophage Rac